MPQEVPAKRVAEDRSLCQQLTLEAAYGRQSVVIDRGVLSDDHPDSLLRVSTEAEVTRKVGGIFDLFDALAAATVDMSLPLVREEPRKNPLVTAAALGRFRVLRSRSLVFRLLRRTMT